MSVPKRISGGPPGSRTAYDMTPDGKLAGLITAGQFQFQHQFQPSVQRS